MAIVIPMLLGVGGLIYSNQKTEAREAREKQALIESINTQHTLENQAKVAKASAPVVSEEYPARITPEAVIDPQEAPAVTEQTNQRVTPQEIPQQSPPPLEVAPAQVVIPPSVNQEPVPAITVLSDTDIQKLQSYSQLKGSSGGSYTSFENMYSNQRNNCDALMERFSALSLSDYSKANVEWLTSPKLIYKNVLSQYCIRGIVTLTYYEAGNKFSLSPNVKYQREVEYQLRNSVTDGTMTLKLEGTTYLGEFKVVK